MSIDRDYSIIDFVPGGAELPERWLVDATGFREMRAAIGQARLNVPYGPHERHKLDLFYPGGKPVGLVVFVHGGYWRRFDRGYRSHYARGLTENGWAAALPSYRLAPEARIGEITVEIARSVEVAADLVAGPIRLAGHSAGGHLVARLGCRDIALSGEVRARLARIMAISPVSDLRPLTQTAMNVDLRLDPAETEAESPVLHQAPACPVTVWVGAEERPVFLDQARWLAEAWGAEMRIDPGRHHFDLLDGLEAPESPLIAALLA